MKVEMVESICAASVFAIMLICVTIGFIYWIKND